MFDSRSEPSQDLTVLRIERRGRFHSYERHELEQVVLHNVADKTDPIEVSSATLHSDVFLEGDSNRGDVVAVPKNEPNKT